MNLIDRHVRGRRPRPAGSRLPWTGFLLLCCAAALPAQPNAAQQPAVIRVEPVRGHMYLIGGAGGNILASMGPDGVLLVDSGLAQNADKVLAAINELNREIANRGGLPTTTVIPPKPIRYIINTHLHPDHTGGN